ncbi:MAG: class I SAM-dependent methyltransferase [Comamonadaceae bacterium]|nr:class I SAM-dependent methyltransferase [Comamonadaceae bacterium]
MPCPYLPFIFAILHLSYGLGFLSGLVKFANRWGDKTGKTPSISMKPSSDDLSRLRTEYADRERRLAGSDVYSLFNPANLFAIQGRQRAVLAALKSHHFTDLADLHILEMGCGNGGVLTEFITFGASPANLFGVDLLFDRLLHAGHILRRSHFANADGSHLPFPDHSFDVVLQFTALSSILDPHLRRDICADMLRVLRPSGLILSYDFWLNPTNPQTRGIRPAEIRRVVPPLQVSLSAHHTRPAAGAQAGAALLVNGLFLESLRIFNSHYLSVIEPLS